MKRNITMKTVNVIRNSLLGVSAIVMALMVFACENPIEQPFKAGLGPVVDTRPPTVTLNNPSAGDYIWGKDKIFEGFAEDDYKLAKVEMKVTNHKGLQDESAEDVWKDYQPVTLTLPRQNTGFWDRVFDTTLYKDGDLKIRLRVTDSTNKTTETEEISFYINNDRPAISITAPPVVSAEVRLKSDGVEYDDAKDKDGMVGGKLGRLNYETKASLIPYAPHPDYGKEYPRAMDKGSSLSGSISDAQDIYTGPITTDPIKGNRYPPQIRIWRVNDKTNPQDADGYLPGVMPTEAQVPWHTLRMEGNMDTDELFPIGMGKYQFTYELPPEINRYYGFEIRAQNEDGRSFFHYPRNCYADGPGTDWTDTEHILKSYVLIYVRPQREAPEVGIYGLEDIYKYWENGGIGSYPVLSDSNGPLNEHRYHPYIDGLTTVNKNANGFILRIKGKHSDDIGFAAVYWTREGSSERGRFIWDEANAPHTGVTTVETSNPYTEWGYRDPQVGSDGKITRSFFFTYNPAAINRIPNETSYHPDVRNKSRIQTLKPSVSQTWKSIKEGTPGADLWDDKLTPLEDGVYNFEIYIRSRSGTVPQSVNCSVRLDTAAPYAEVLDVEGNYLRIDAKSNVSYLINGKSHTKTRNASSPVEYIVNGVVQPNLLFTDDGSGPRTATRGTYFSNAGRQGYEQLYVLVNYNDRTALQALINGTKNWWPVDEAWDMLAVSIPAVKNGRVPLDDGKFRFKLKTSAIYDPAESVTDNDNKILNDSPDNEPYYLYVFCRDNAFNVGHTFVTLDVKAETDLPELDFSAGAIKEVTDPNSDADYVTSIGFYDTRGVLRNKLTGGSPIRLYIKDDDSLDLGTGLIPSGVKVTIDGSHYDGPRIKANDSPVTLGDSAIKSIFLPPTTLPTRREQAIKSIAGGSAIPQQALAAALGQSGPNLNDGIYKITVQVSDLALDPIKMTMAAADPAPAVASSPTKEFWVVVDTTPPQYTLAPSYLVVGDTTGSFQPEDYVDTGFIRGTVTDENGPITIVETKVRNNDADRTINTVIFFDSDLIESKVEQVVNPAVWEGAFEVPVRMNNESGRFQFEITFQDRFENRKTLSMWLSADNIRPTAVIGTKMPVFERNYNDPLDNLGTVSPTNRLRLANGVLNFTVSAQDFTDTARKTPGKIKSIKWWLVNGDTFTIPTPSQYQDTTVDLDMYSAVKWGVLTRDFTAPQYIDTRIDVPDGLYTLLVMAEDNAGNISYTDNALTTVHADARQTIYVLQAHDKPYFGFSSTGDLPLTIAPDGGKVTGSSIVSGKFYDDDGFYDSNNNPLAGSVKIWVSTATDANVQIGDSDPTGNNGYGSGLVLTSGLSRAAKIGGNSVMNLNVDLKSLFPASFNTDGSKYYIIGVQDSHWNKINPNGSKPAMPESAERAIRYKRFNFVYDTQAPIITLTNHASTGVKTFGPNANDNTFPLVNFRLEGTITEANLKRTGGTTGDYYIEYYLDSNSQSPKRLVLNGTGITTTPASPGPGIDFTVNADVFCSAVNLNFASNTAVTPDTNHSITFIAYDQSDKKGTYTFNFIKDMTKPGLTFIVPGTKKELGRIGNPAEDWWTSTNYDAKRTWLNTVSNDLPVVRYDKSNPDSKPQLKVTFDDITSFINTSTLKYYIDGESASRPVTQYTVTPSVSNTVRSVSCTIELVNAAGTAYLLDGVHSIRFEIADSVGNTLWPDERTTDTGSGNNIYYGFRINSGPPTITMNAVDTGNVYGIVSGNDTTPFFTIGGALRGANLHDDTSPGPGRVVIRYNNSPSTTPNTQNLTGTNLTGWAFTPSTNEESWNWNRSVLRSYLLSAGGTSALREGEYQLELQARGRVDTDLSEATVWPFTIDTSSPVITIDDFTTTMQSTADWRPNQWGAAEVNPNRKVLTSNTTPIRGRVTDTYSNLTKVDYLIQKFNYAEGNWTQNASYYNAAAANWQTTEVWNELLTSAEKTRQKEVTLTPGSITGITDGFYRVRLRARDSARVNGSTGTLWPNSVNDVYDGNPVRSNYYYFFYAPTNTKPSIESFDNESQTLYSAAAAATPGTLSFSGTADSLNGYASMTVQITKGGAAVSGITTTPSGIPVSPPSSGAWNPNNQAWGTNLAGFSVNSTDARGDGVYTLTFTVTDWAGRTASRFRTITVDNKKPTGAVTYPMLLSDAIRDTTVNSSKIYANASETFYGGEEARIEGTAEDTNSVAGIWYHLGYPDALNTNNMPFPTEAQIINSALSRNNDRGGPDNVDFDNAAKAFGETGSKPGWFKYDLTNSTIYPKPDIDNTVMFDNYTSPIYNWKLNIPVSSDKSLSSYAGKNITVKGTSYTGPNAIGPRMTQEIDQSGLSPTEQKNGLYSLPLYVRVVDSAGNVFYFCQDIWLYPNGDYPSNVVTNPGLKPASQNESRGGTITFDGIASDNRNVRNVIYRVRADNKKYGNEGWTAAPTDDAATQFVKPKGGTEFDIGFTEWSIFNSAARDPAITTTGWYKATLEAESDITKTKAWSFLVNANNEFTLKDASGKSLIDKWGFASGSGANDMIRVYVEVLAFDGGGATDWIANKMSLGPKEDLAGTATPNPTNLGRPEVVVFYLSSTSPAIENNKINAVGAFNTATTSAAADYIDYTGETTRNNRFAVRAELYSGSTAKGIGEVQVRLSSESGQQGDNTLAQWRSVWKSGTTTTTTTPTGITFFDPLTPGTSMTNPPSTSTPQTRFGIRYAFSTATATADGFQRVMNGAWAATGGKYEIEVRLRDSSNPPAETTYKFTVGIDNFAPVADTQKVVSNPKVAGSNQPFQGRAYDYSGLTDSNASPGYYGIEKVYAWFTTNSNGTTGNVSMTTKGTTQNLGTNNRSSIPAFQNRAATLTMDGEKVTNIALSNAGTSGTRYYPVPTLTNGVESSNQWVKVINENQAAVLTNNMTWQPITPGRSVYWSFITDTTKLPDGPIYLNYIVVDSAGNASIYQQRMVVMNNYPLITGITLYTDNTGQGAVFTTHEGNEASSYFQVPSSMPAGYLNSGFISKNKYIGFRVETKEGSGNGSMHYRVQYVERETIALDNANLRAIAADAAKAPANRTYSSVYTIADKGGMDDAIWAKLNGDRTQSYSNGTHFVFRATTNDIGELPTGMNYPGTTVYRYTVKLTKDKEKSGTNVPSVPQGEKLQARSFVDDKEFFNANGQPINTDERGFRFITTSIYGGGSINDFASIPEKMGSRPDDSTKNKPDAEDSTGTAFFLIKVYDSVISGNWDYGSGSRAVTEDDQLYDALVVGMNVYLNDSEKPVARLYDLNPYTETAVVGNNIGDTNVTATIKNAADPVAIGNNIIRGGLYNANTERELVKSGYIEPRATSYALNPKNSNGKQTGVAVPANDYPLKQSADVVTGGETLDKVSGKVILRGIAWDDQLIEEIWIQIGTNSTTNPAKLILRLVGDTMTAQSNHKAYAAATLHWQTGHTVEWAYVWNTEDDPVGRTGGGPSSNVPVQVFVKDKNGNKYSNTKSGASPFSGTTGVFITTPAPPDWAYETTDDNSDTFHNQVNVDIVPYIIGFQRETPKFTTTRSLQGWYSFYQGESNIALLGYNFGRTPSTSATTDGVRLYLGATSTLDATADYIRPYWNTNPTGVTNTQNHFSFSIPDGAKSGRLHATVAVSGTATAAYNHTSKHADKSWNREYNSFTPGSDLWVNKPHAHIWRTSPADPTTSPRTYIGNNYSAAAVTSSSSGLDHPGMALEYVTGGAPGTLHGTWSVYAKANSYYGTNAGGGNPLHTETPPSEPYGTPDISIFNGGGAAAANIGYVHQSDGRPTLVLKARVTNTSGANDDEYRIQANTANPDNNNQAHPTQRWQNIRVSKAAANAVANTDGSMGRLYMTAFDSERKSLWYGTRGTTTGTTQGDTVMLIDGGTNANITSVTASGLTPVANAGQYSAVDYDNFNLNNTTAIRPIIAYYDGTNDTVRVALAPVTNPEAAPNAAANRWNRVNLLPSTHALYHGSGKYISIKVDRENHIHIAFYNSVWNKMVYYYAKDRTFIGTTPGTTATSDVRVFTVDDVLTSGGIWTDISVDNNGNPWIVYGDSSRTGNYDGVRMAYQSGTTTGVQFSGTLNCTVTGADIKGWEALTMPANFTVGNDRLNIEAWPPTNRAGGTLPGGPGWNAAIGYPSDMFRVGYFTYPTYKGYGSNTQNAP